MHVHVHLPVCINMYSPFINTLPMYMYAYECAKLYLIPYTSCVAVFCVRTTDRKLLRCLLPLSELLTEDYALLAVDLTRLDTLTSCLTDVGVDTALPTLFLSEVVLTYMKPQQ